MGDQAVQDYIDGLRADVERLRAQVEKLTDERESALAAAAFWRSGNGQAQVDQFTAERDAAVAKAERLTAEEQEHLDLIAHMSKSAESREAFIRGLEKEIERRKSLFRLGCKANDALVAQRDALLAAKGELVAALRGAVSVLDQNLDEWERGLEALAKHGGGRDSGVGRPCGFETGAGWGPTCTILVHGDGPYCEKHTRPCVGCGDPSTRECSASIGVMCGFPLCDQCEHLSGMLLDMKHGRKHGGGS